QSPGPMFLFCSRKHARIISWLAQTQPSDARRRPAPPGPVPPRRRAVLPPAQDPSHPGLLPSTLRPRSTATWRWTAPPAAGGGRGAKWTASGRYEPLARIAFDDGWESFEELPPFKTTVTLDSTRKIIARNDSPDISFDRSINPYRGCEHGCIYCFARPTHAY